MTVKTELECAYEPPDYFEAPLRQRLPGATAVFEGGKAVVTLDVPSPELPPGQRAGLTGEVESILLARQLLTHRPYRLTRATVVQYQADGRRGVFVELSGASVGTSTVGADIVVTNAAGEVVHDTRAERIARDEAFVAALAPKLARSPVLRALVRSYAQAVRDPGDELTHLYEIRDALAAHYGSDHAARQALLPAGVTRAAWSRLGELACRLPLTQGRHRGEHVGVLRPATAEELQEARALARTLVEAFAAGVL